MLDAGIDLGAIAVGPSERERKVPVPFGLLIFNKFLCKSAIKKYLVKEKKQLLLTPYIPFDSFYPELY